MHFNSLRHKNSGDPRVDLNCPSLQLPKVPGKTFENPKKEQYRGINSSGKSESIDSEKSQKNDKTNKIIKMSQKLKKKGNWLEFEDQKLLEWVETQGPSNWTECAKLIKGRCGKQCRERWVNALDPRIKRGNWEEGEHTLIFKQMKQNWSSWTVISKKLPGRTENAIKNYFYSSIRRLRISELFKFIRIIIGADQLIRSSQGRDAQFF